MKLSAPERLGGAVSNPDARRRLVWAALLAAALSSGVATAATAQASDGYQAVGATAAYLGVVPAEVVQGHSPERPESRMHGGPLEGRHAEHIVVALFDTQSGRRIEDATVSATIISHGGLNPIEIDLEPMRIAGVITYGGFVSFPGEGDYLVEVVIRRPGEVTPIRIPFDIEHVSG